MGAAEEMLSESVPPDDWARTLASVVKALCAPLVSARPTLDDETRAAARHHVLFSMFRDERVPGILSVFRERLTSEIEELERLELEVDEVEKKLACRHLRDAAEVTFDIVSLLGGSLLAQHTVAPSGAVRYSDDQVLLELSKDPEMLDLALLTLRVSVGLVSKTAETRDFAFWARRALESARAVRPLIPHLSARMRAELVRAEAKVAWEDWTEEDAREELNAWRTFA